MKTEQSNIQPARFLKSKPGDTMRRKMKVLGYAPTTINTYTDWALRYLKFHGAKDPKLLNEVHIRQFIDHEVNVNHLGIRTHNQIKAAMNCLYDRVLGIKLGAWNLEAVPHDHERIPVVFPSRKWPA